MAESLFADKISDKITEFRMQIRDRVRNPSIQAGDGEDSSSEPSSSTANGLNGDSQEYDALLTPARLEKGMKIATVIYIRTCTCMCMYMYTTII